MKHHNFIESFILALMVLAVVTAIVTALAVYFALRDWSSWASIVIGVVGGLGTAIPLASIAIVVSLLVSIEERIALLADSVRSE